MFPDGREVPQPVGSAIPYGFRDIPQIPYHNYTRNAQEGYMRNELVYACVEMRATSAAEPRLVVYRKNEKLTDHPVQALWDRPNPFMDRYAMTAGMIMFRDIGGNSFVEKVRNRLGKTVELWQLRPDRVFIIPDNDVYIAGYQYRWGPDTFYLPQPDVIHFKNRHPMDEFYGMPPLAPLAARVDLDNWMRDFTRAFFLNAGVPAGMINVKHAMEAQDRELLRTKFRQEYGGPAGWHQALVIDGGEASYTPMGMPMGARGLAMPELDEINEARICMAYGVPLSLIGARLGMSSSSYGNRRQDETNFWELTLVPLYVELAATLTRGLKDEYEDGPDAFDRLAFDMSDVDALQGDQTELHKRWREDMLAGGITREEFRKYSGYPTAVDGKTWFMPMGAMQTGLGDSTANIEASGGGAGGVNTPSAESPTNKLNRGNEGSRDNAGSKMLDEKLVSSNGHHCCSAKTVFGIHSGVYLLETKDVTRRWLLDFKQYVSNDNRAEQIMSQLEQVDVAGEPVVGEDTGSLSGTGKTPGLTDTYEAVDIDWHMSFTDAPKSPAIGKAKPGAKEAVQWFLDNGLEIYFSCGGLSNPTTGPILEANMRGYLAELGFNPHDERFHFRAKPRTLAVIDDRAVVADDWDAIRAEVERRWRAAESPGSGATVEHRVWDEMHNDTQTLK